MFYSFGQLERNIVSERGIFEKQSFAMEKL